MIDILPTALVLKLNNKFKNCKEIKTVSTFSNINGRFPDHMYFQGHCLLNNNNWVIYCYGNGGEVGAVTRVHSPGSRSVSCLQATDT